MPYVSCLMPKGRRDMAITITEDQREQYREEGYFILEGVIPDRHLELLRSECDGFIERINRQMDTAGTDTLGINHRDSRYFIANCIQERPALGEFIFSDLMADICRATLGDDAYLFWNQYVVKCAEVGM